MAIIFFYNVFSDLKAYNPFVSFFKFFWYIVRLFYDLCHIYDEFFDYEFSVLWKKGFALF